MAGQFERELTKHVKKEVSGIERDLNRLRPKHEGGNVASAGRDVERVSKRHGLKLDRKGRELFAKALVAGEEIKWTIKK